MENDAGEDLFNVVCGDLGLGQSTRSSIYLNYQEPFIWSDPGNHGDSLSNSELEKTGKALPGSSKGKLIPGKHLFKGKYDNPPEDCEVFPTYADIPYGTSLRQQKKLYEQQMDNLCKQHCPSVSEDTDKDSKPENLSNMTVDEIDVKLNLAIQEMEELKIELDACHKRLDAKYKAVTILKRQAEIADSELKDTEQKAKENNKRLEKEVCKLQFELEWKESSFLDSQQTWAARFDRVCQENATLMLKLEARNEELRRANAHKTALVRERDELLALLDVTERIKYEQGKSRVAEEDYGTFSSTELAVLGACKCRVSSPEPCGCAHAAANLRKDVVKIREEAELHQRRWEEANLTVDAYRMAFEEQLSKSRSMSLRLSQMATLTSRSSKAKAAIKFLIQVLNDDDFALPSRVNSPFEDKDKGFPAMSLQELVTILTDMVSEKKEAIAHQKLANHLLANKLHLLESHPHNHTLCGDNGNLPQTHNHHSESYRKTETNKDSAQSCEVDRNHIQTFMNESQQEDVTASMNHSISEVNENKIKTVATIEASTGEIGTEKGTNDRYHSNSLSAENQDKPESVVRNGVDVADNIKVLVEKATET